VNSDHVLVAADLVFTIMKPKKTDEVRRPYDVDRLSSSSELQQHYSSKVQNKFDVLGTHPDDVTSQWESLCSVIRESADEVICPRKNIRQPCSNRLQLNATKTAYKSAHRR